MSKAGPKISVHSSGRLYTTITVNGAKKFVYGATEDEVYDQWLELKRMSRQGYNVAANYTVEEYAIRWYNLFKKPKQGKGGSVKTKEMYINIIEVHIIPAMGKKRVRDVNTSDIQELLNNASSSKSLQHKVRITLNQIFNKAIADKLISSNPVVGTNAVDAPEPSRPVYTPEQVTIMLELFEGFRIYPLLYTILHTGMRATEAIALIRTRDLDLDNNIIYVRESTEFIKAQPQQKSTKTERGVRAIPIPPVFSDWLRDYLKEVKSLYVFPGRDGGQMGETTLDGMRNRANRKIEGWFSRHPEKKDLRFKLHYKTLRHTYCTELYDLEIDEVSASKIMGHSVTIMREIYTHIQKSRQQKTRVKIENLYNNVIHFSTGKPVAKSR